MEAIHTLTKDNLITILPADKGRTIVVMDTEQYKKTNDKNAGRHQYLGKISKKGPNRRKETETEIPAETSTKQEQNKQGFIHLVRSANTTPRIYGTQKIHTTGTPLRSIVDWIGSLTNGSIGSLTCNLSKALVGESNLYWV